MSKARDLANASTALGAVSATELAFVDGVTSAIQTQLDAKTAKSTLTTTGDIYYASAANTPARLGIGTATQLLAVNSGATAPEWVAAPSSGSMTLISTTTLSGTSITLSSIPSTYNDLRIVIRDFLPSGNYNYMFLRFNGDTANRYTTNNASTYGIDTVRAFGASSLYAGSSNSNSVANGLTVLSVFDYANTVTYKLINITSIGADGGVSSSGAYSGFLGAYNQVGAITSITLFVDNGTFTSGTVLLYGVK
jgi:hypothetical protein